jgi:hypothetical protein
MSDSQATAITTNSKPTLGNGYLRGQKPLWKAFWLTYALGCTAVAILSQIGAHCVTAIPTISLCSINPAHYLLLVVFFNVAYSAYAWLCVWRCALNVKNRIFRYLARIIICIHAAWYLPRALRLIYSGIASVYFFH